jgi:hypothetical protein
VEFGRASVALAIGAVVNDDLARVLDTDLASVRFHGGDSLSDVLIGG